MVADDADVESEADFFLMKSLSGVKIDGGGGGGAGGGGSGRSFCSATSSLFTRSTSVTDSRAKSSASLHLFFDYPLS